MVTLSKVFTLCNLLKFKCLNSVLSTHWTGDWVGPRSRTDMITKKICHNYQESNSSVVIPSLTSPSSPSPSIVTELFLKNKHTHKLYRI